MESHAYLSSAGVALTRIKKGYELATHKMKEGADVHKEPPTPSTYPKYLKF
jgi:hypothetical protein